MITYKTGNLFDAPVEALVNTVNTAGVMGKGIALQFKNTFPENFKAYREAFRCGLLQLGKVLVVPIHPFGKVMYIINFPTKGHWRNPSKIEWIKSGLEDLRAKINENGIKSIALPQLGCGNGGLDWQEVRPVIENAMHDLDIDIFIYEPGIQIQELLKGENTPSAAGLTPVPGNSASGLEK